MLEKFTAPNLSGRNGRRKRKRSRKGEEGRGGESREMIGAREMARGEIV